MEIGVSKDLIRSMSLGLIGWYDFEKSAKGLIIGDGNDPYADFFCSEGYDFELISPDSITEELVSINEDKFEFGLLISCLEKAKDPAEKLKMIKRMMKPEGHLLIGMTNRLGIEFFCGDIDPYTGREFDSIEGYSDIDRTEAGFCGRCYSQREIKNILEEAGYGCYKLYSVLPGLNEPSIILSEKYTPGEELCGRVFPYYNDPDSVFMKEEALYSALIDNSLFHGMANAYLIECTDEGKLSDVLQVTSSMDRGPENAFFTIIHEGQIVEKKAAYSQGEKKLERMIEFNSDLSAHGIRVVECELKDGVLVMPYMENITSQMYFKDLFYNDRNRFLSEMDRFRDTIMKSSDHGMLDDGTEVLKRGYFDLVPLNSFFDGEDFVFFDQEFCIEDLPAKVMEWRMIASFYFGDPLAQKVLPMEKLLERYGLLEELSRWQKTEWDYLDKLLNNKKLWAHHSRHRTNSMMIKRRKALLDRRFINIFDGIEGKKLFLFGSGKYADRFLDMYGDDFPIYGFLDNDEKKTGSKKRDIIIYKPDILKKFNSDELKVMICLRDYNGAAEQLEELGVYSYSVFDPYRYYETRPRTSIWVGRFNDGSDQAEWIAHENKPYHIGYVAGAFDMFHIGHLNLLRRAKEQCDYLIAGVMSDERMNFLKKKYPVIPCNERLQVVAGCRYVDRVEELPADRAGIRDAFHMFHFDCMFSGDDHATDPGWLEDREYLRKQGSELIFVPYTQDTSSSFIRKKRGERSMDKKNDSI